MSWSSAKNICQPYAIAAIEDLTGRRQYGRHGLAIDVALRGYCARKVTGAGNDEEAAFLFIERIIAGGQLERR